MKKFVLGLVAITFLVVSCVPSAEEIELKRIADSTYIADSIYATDSLTNMSDSTYTYDSIVIIK